MELRLKYRLQCIGSQERARETVEALRSLAITNGFAAVSQVETLVGEETNVAWYRPSDYYHGLATSAAHERKRDGTTHHPLCAIGFRVAFATQTDVGFWVGLALHDGRPERSRAFWTWYASSDDLAALARVEDAAAFVEHVERAFRYFSDGKRAGVVRDYTDSVGYKRHRSIARLLASVNDTTTENAISA